MTLITSSNFVFLFFFNDTATTEIYPLSLHGSSDLSPETRRRASGGRAPPERQSLPADAPRADRRTWSVPGSAARRSWDTSRRTARPVGAYTSARVRSTAAGHPAFRTSYQIGRA